ncbi:hypothetical protein SPSIL_009040 [Sporomusa silvacetica DSM 10669]|uniref:Uncharacterized protein n=1 Tax=Sporomusa silvacetica DSM 10669 TaxID=1123289 RepID=A0ABZ3IGJ7_9FIRM|nr:hypothetical protein [Sporomusa silvacetica]OZC13136.1 hypothetical protein SPSIL_55920 [Sporomusa silvacetica DSM 10669]
MSEESLTAEATTATATASSTATTSGTAATATESQIYVGPNIASERLNRFAVFKNGIPTHMDTVLAACPAVGKLFVPVSKLSETLARISKTGTAYNTWYSQVTAYLQKGAK